MHAKVLMIQGTASHVGKSVLVTALCRAFHRKGLRVVPFKAQNMALNSYVTPDGREIGWAQAVQAQAAGLLPSVHFNPILLKPTGDKKCQVIVHGKPLGHWSAREYERRKPEFWVHVVESLDFLRHRFDLIVIEGAGSPAEINLKKNDIVNMRVARHAHAPVLLVSDIDRGGVFASLLGTLQLLDAQEKRLVRGLIINKFRGDVSILRPGLAAIQRKTRKPVLGVLPYFDFDYQDQEDSVALEENSAAVNSFAGKIRVAVVRNPRISNFTDFDSLRWEPSVALSYVQRAEELDHPDLIVLPGSKNTIEDLKHLRKTGLAQKICSAAAAGTTVLGICGGYQMLGGSIRDPGGVESARENIQGLGLLNVDTVFHSEKTLHQVEFASATGTGKGYEIHMGQTRRNEKTRPLLKITRRSGISLDDEDGAVNARGNVLGTYVHGLLNNDAFRHDLLKTVSQRKGLRLPTSRLLHNFEAQRKKSWDKLADWAEEHLAMQAIRRIAGIRA